jgi:hypothetical protein
MAAVADYMQNIIILMIFHTQIFFRLIQNKYKKFIVVFRWIICLEKSEKNSSKSQIKIS